MGVMYYILSPFSWLLNFFYSFTDSYGISLILFALVIKIILFPLTIKGKKGMIQMNLLSGKMQQLQKQYGKDRERYNIEVQRLYEREKVNPMSGCLWSFLPILILLPLYAIIRQPLLYLMGLDGSQIAQVAAAVDWQTLAVNHGWVTADAMAKLVEQLNAGEITTVFQNVGYNQLYLASLVNENTLPAITAALGEGTRVFVMNFDFLGLDLAMLPTWRIWEHLNWQYIGAFLLIVVSAFSSIFMSKISMKTNQMNNQSGNEQVEKTNRMMMWTMPLVSLWVGFMMPVAMCVYWIANSLLSIIQELIAGKMLKKDYEAARAAAAERERQEKEEEKRRKEEARLERQRRLEEEKKNRGKKKPGQKKGEADQPGIRKSDSRVGMRTYARGRAYDPNRFGGVTPYHDPNAPEIPEDAVEQARGEKGEQAELAQTGEALETAVLPEGAPAAEEKETAVPEPGDEAGESSEEELSGEEAEEAEQDESGEDPDEDESRDQAE